MNDYFKQIGLSGGYRSFLIPCEVCGSEDFMPVQEAGRIGAPGVYGKLPVKGCKVCGYIMINPRYEDKFYVDYYHKVYQKVANEVDKPTSEYIELQKYRGGKIADYTKQFMGRPGKMLDLGCAVGATMIPFLQRGWDVVGVDPDESSVKVGRKEYGLNLQLAEAESMDLGDNTFDFVMTLGTIEHFYDLWASLLAIKKVLKKDGFLFMRYRCEQLWGSVLEYFNHNHYRYFTSKTMELLLARYGFEVSKFEHEELEEIPGAAYVIARSSSDPSLDAVFRKIASGCRDEINQRKEYFGNHQAEFMGKCGKLIEAAKDCGYDYAFIAQQISEGKLDIRILNGSPVNAVKRAIMEAEEALKHENSRTVE